MDPQVHTPEITHDDHGSGNPQVASTRPDDNINTLSAVPFSGMVRGPSDNLYSFQNNEETRANKRAQAWGALFAGCSPKVQPHLSGLPQKHKILRILLSAEAHVGTPRHVLFPLLTPPLNPQPYLLTIHSIVRRQLRWGVLKRSVIILIVQPWPHTAGWITGNMVEVGGSTTTLLKF